MIQLPGKGMVCPSPGLRAGWGTQALHWEPWQAQRPGEEQPPGEGSLQGGVGWCWGGFPSCTQQLGWFCNREEWFRCWGCVFIGSLLRLTVGNGWSWQRKPNPRSFLGQKPLSRVHPGSWLSNIIQKPQFTVLNMIQRWESCRSCSEVPQMDRCRQARNRRLRCQQKVSYQQSQHKKPKVY